jgi:hypothetical protein
MMETIELPTNRFVGSWRPTTAGELLLHFLATNVVALRDIGFSRMDGIAGITRASPFAQFIDNCVVLHCFGRLLQVSKHLRNINENAVDARTAIEKFAINSLNISRGSALNFDELPTIALEAAEASSEASRRIKSSVKSTVLNRYNGTYACYSCDGPLAIDAPQTLPGGCNPRPNPQYLDFDHLWPHSLGGSSVEENLLPSCQFCNKAKGDNASWEWVPLQALLPETVLDTLHLESKLLTKAEKIALHMRAAFEYARTNGATLKDAYIAIGPRLPNVTLVDPSDTPDFFNLRVHDEDRSGISWRMA